MPAQGRRAYVKCPEASAGFSLPETVLAMALMVLTITALGGYQRGMAQGIVQLNQTRQLWRDAWRYSQLSRAAVAGTRAGKPYADIEAKMCQHHGNDQ